MTQAPADKPATICHSGGRAIKNQFYEAGQAAHGGKRQENTPQYGASLIYIKDKTVR